LLGSAALRAPRASNNCCRGIGPQMLSFFTDMSDSLRPLKTGDFGFFEVRYEAEHDITPETTPGSEQETHDKTAAPELDVFSEEQRRCHAVIRLMEDAILSREKALLILVPSGPQTKQRPLHELTDIGHLAFVSRPLTDQLLAREDLADLDIKTARLVDMSGLVGPPDILRRPPGLRRLIPSNGYEYSYSSDYESGQSGAYSYYSDDAHSEGYYTYDTGGTYDDEHAGDDMRKTSMLFRNPSYAGPQPSGTAPPPVKTAEEKAGLDVIRQEGVTEAVTELADTKLTGLAGTEPAAAAGTVPVVAADDKSSSASSFYDEPAAAADTAPVAAADDESSSPSSFYDEYGYTYDDSPAWQIERMAAAATGQM